MVLEEKVRLFDFSLELEGNLFGGVIGEGEVVKSDGGSNSEFCLLDRNTTLLSS